MKAYIKNLHDQILEPEYKGIVAMCPKCKDQYSANKGDYWNRRDNDKLICIPCHRIMELVRPYVVFGQADKAFVQ